MIAAIMTCFLAATVAAETPAQTPEAAVSVTLTPPVIPYHRQSHLTIVVTAPNDAKTELPDITKLIGALELAGPLTAPRTEKLKDGRRRTSVTYNLEAVWAGSYPILPVTVTYGEGKSVTVPAPALRVRDLTEEEAKAAGEFAPNAAPKDPKLDLLHAWWFWALMSGCVAALLATAVFFLRRRRLQPRAAPPALPWETAYQRLRDLDTRQFPEAGLYEPYYVELSSILRHYIEDRFHLHAPEQTTPEFLAEASRSGVLSQSHQALLAGFLRHSDRVKFALYEPGLGEMERSMAEVLQFVDETVPAPQPEKEAAA